MHSKLTAFINRLSISDALGRSHVYIPILPRCLLGVLSAPVPLILGVNSAFLPTSEDQDHDQAQKEEEQQQVQEQASSPPTPAPQEQEQHTRSMTTSSSFDLTSSASSSSLSTTGDESSTTGSTDTRNISVATASSTFVNTDGEKNFEGESGERPSEFVDDRYYAGE